MPYQRTETFQPPGIDSGQTALHSGLADALTQFGNLVQDVGTPIVADLGARAGLEAGGKREGSTKIQVGPYNRAYNEAFLRAYTLDVYADTEADFLRLEADAKGDPALFEATATKRRDAILANVLPVARPYVSASIEERMNSARTRLVQGQIAAEEVNIRESTLRGLDTMRRDASRLLTSGTEEGFQRGVKMSMAYGSMIDKQVAAGVLKPAEGQKLIEAALRANAADVALGRFQGALDEPGGDPVAIIRETLESDDPNFDDADRQQVASEMMRRLGVQNGLARAGDAELDALQKEVWADTEKEATLRLLNGSLTSSWMSSQVARDRMDPQLARTLHEAQTSDTGDDEQGSLTDVLINWRSMTTAEILAKPGLSLKTKMTYVAKIADRQEDWRDSDEYQEGRSTIARAAGVSLENLGLAGDEAKEKVSLALTRFDRELANMPDEERIAATIGKADEIVEVIIKGQAMATLSKAEERFKNFDATFLKNSGSSADTIDELSPAQKELYDKRKAARLKEIEDLRKTVRGK